MAENEECTHDCSGCDKECSSRSPLEKDKTNDKSNVKKVIAVVSGKGGVGKSEVTSMLAVLLHRKGYSTAVLDADLTGPSIPKIFGPRENVTSDGVGLIPIESKTGIKLMSINYLLPNETDPLVWRSPLITGTVKQFWTEVNWGDVDYMFIDMPPGTGDVPLTIFQSVPLDGIVIVTTPQDLVSMIVEKSVNMAHSMGIPIIGLVENMSYVECPDCGKKIEVFGKSKADTVCSDMGIKLLARIPMKQEFAELSDNGNIEDIDVPFLDEAVKMVEELK